MADKKIKLTLIRGLSSCTKKQRETVKGLGLSKKINNQSILTLNPCVDGMIRKVKHLVKYEEL